MSQGQHLDAMMTEMPLTHQTMRVREIIDRFRTGRLLIPEFQREYVWPKSNAPKLVESLYRGYPISSLLVWESTERVEVRRLEPRRDLGGPIGWLVDGQQRVITLVRTQSGDEDIDVVFNTERPKFSRSNAATNKDHRWVHVSDAWDNEWYRAYRKKLSDSPADKRIEGRLEQLRSVLDYEIPTVHMVDYSFEDAVECFRRLNSNGVRLKASDLESAKVAAQHAGFVRKKVIPFLQKLQQRGYDRIAATHLFRTCAFIAHPDGRRRTPLYELHTQDVEKAWRRTEDAVECALSLLSSELGIVGTDILWSASLLVPVFALCAMPPKSRNDKEIAGWIALAALCHRYSRSSDTMIDQDLKACRRDDSIGALLANLRNRCQSLVATRHDFDTSVADRSGLFAAYVACAFLGNKDLLSGGRTLARKKIDKHHILPRSRFGQGSDRSRADVVANIGFIAADSNKSIGDDEPSRYLARVPASVLTSQAIPLDQALWSTARADEFWIERQDLLSKAFNSFVKESLSGRHLS